MNVREQFQGREKVNFNASLLESKRPASATDVQKQSVARE